MTKYLRKHFVELFITLARSWYNINTLHVFWSKNLFCWFTWLNQFGSQASSRQAAQEGKVKADTRQRQKKINPSWRLVEARTPVSTNLSPNNDGVECLHVPVLVLNNIHLSNQASLSLQPVGLLLNTLDIIHSVLPSSYTTIVFLIFDFLLFWVETDTQTLLLCYTRLSGGGGRGER